MSLALPNSQLLLLCAGCPYKYVQHLISDPNCSPYPNGIMKLECTVEVPLNATDITIGWFLNCEQLSNDSHVTITPQVIQSTEVRRLRSQLRINDMTDDYAGEYTCNILGDEEYVPSDKFVLGDSNYLEVDFGLGPCPDGNVFTDAAPAEEKCAVITEDNPIPTPLICETPPATSSQTLVTTTEALHVSSSPTLSVLAKTHISTALPLQTPTIIGPTPTSAEPTSTDPEDNNNMTPSSNSLNTVSLSLIALSSLLTIIIINKFLLTL